MTTRTTHSENRNKLDPSLRFKEYKKPWEKKELGKICTFFSGGTPSSTNKEFYSGNIPFIGSGNIYDSKVFSFITEEALESSSAKMVEQGDLLCALYGANSGEVAISKIDGAINQAVLCIRTQEAFIEFIYFLLLHNKERIVSKYLQGGQGNLSANIIKRLIYYFPTLPEQQKIASFLSAIDEKIQQLTRKKELLEQYKKGVMQQLFSGKMRFKDENGKAYPKWEEKPFGEVCTFINGKAYKQDELLKDGKYRVLRVGNLFSNNEWYYSDLELEEDKYIENGDLIYAWSATFGPRFWEEEKVIYHYHIWKVIPTDEVDKHYLFHAFLFDVERIKAVSQGGTMFHITKRNIETRKFKFPHKAEQKQIATYLSSLDTKIESVTAQITQTQTFKKGLLQQMFV